jgi:hypothetical protein
MRENSPRIPVKVDHEASVHLRHLRTPDDGTTQLGSLASQPGEYPGARIWAAGACFHDGMGVRSWPRLEILNQGGRPPDLRSFVGARVVPIIRLHAPTSGRGAPALQRTNASADSCRAALPVCRPQPGECLPRIATLRRPAVARALVACAAIERSVPASHTIRGLDYPSP